MRSSSGPRGPLLLIGGPIAALVLACAPAVRRIGPPSSAAAMAELWIDPEGVARDLGKGAAAGTAVPKVGGSFRVLKRDASGYSITYRVSDAAGREWSVKIGPEAQPEVVSSRIVWALGYHELPSYFVERWTALTGEYAQVLGGARFRPRDDGLRSQGAWSWQQNPFVGTRPYKGLLVLMMILNSTDLKNDNNGVFEVVGPPREHASRWYIVKDLGASLGETGRMDPRRGDVESFEREPFILPARGPYVRFAFSGRHQELVQRIEPEDVRWMCERLQRLTDRQWRDAFRAGGYDDARTTRFVERIRQKIDQGLHLARERSTIR